MAKYLPLPNGDSLKVPDDMGYDQAMAIAQQKFPELFQAEAKPESGFTPALKAGFKGLQGDIAALAGRSGLMDLAAAEEYKRQKEAEAKQIFAPTQEGWTEAPWTKIKELAGGSLPYMAAPLAAGAAAATAPVSAPVATALGMGAAGLTSAAQFTGSNLSRQMEEGKSLGETDLGSAALASVPQAALDVVGFKMIPGIRRLFGAAGKELTEAQARQVIDKSLKSVIADYTLSTGKTMGAEGLTEAGQQVFERLQAGLSLTDEKARDEYLENFIGGAVLGGILAPAGRFVERGGEQTKAQEFLDKQEREREEATRNTPEALVKLGTDFQLARTQIINLNDALRTKPGKKASEEEKAQYAALKEQRDALLEQYKPLAQEYAKRKDAVDAAMAQAQSQAETGVEQRTASKAVPGLTPEVTAEDLPAAMPYQLSPMAQLMDQHQLLGNQISDIQTQLENGPDVDTQLALTQQLSDLQARQAEMGQTIETQGGTTLTQEQHDKAVAATEKARLDALQKGDWEAATKQAQKLKALQAQVPALQELAYHRERKGVAAATPEGETIPLFSESTEGEKGRQKPLKFVGAEGKPLTGLQVAKKAAEKAAAPETPVVAAGLIKEAQRTTDNLADAVKNAPRDEQGQINTDRIYEAIKERNAAENALSRAETTGAKKGLTPVVLDIFDLGNQIRTAIQNGDTALVDRIAKTVDKQTLDVVLDAKASEREKLAKVLDAKLDVPGTKRERADLFSQWYSPKQQVEFKNGTSLETIERQKLDADGRPEIGKNGLPVVETVKLQDIYDKGGAQAVEYEVVMSEIAEISKKVTTKQGNAKKSLVQELYDLAAEHERLKAQLESGIAEPTMREKVAGVQAKLGKGEAPAQRQMDAKELHDLKRRITTVENKFRAVEGKVAPIREQVQKLYSSLYKTTQEAPVSKVREEERKRLTESSKPARMSREARLKERIDTGNVRKEAEASTQMKELAKKLGMEEAEWEKYGADLMKKVNAIEKVNGKGSQAGVDARIDMANKLDAKAVELGKKTPEYKATLKEQIDFMKAAFESASEAGFKQTVPTKRTTQVTRKQSAAPKRLKTASPESRAASKTEQDAYAARRGMLRDLQEGVESERQGREEDRFLRGVETESVDLSKDQVSLINSNKVQSVLLAVSNDDRYDPFTRAVAKALRPFLDNTNIRIDDKVYDGEGREVLGSAISTQVLISRNGGLSVETLLHESTHAAAERIVALAEQNPSALTKEQTLAINELKAIHARVKNDSGITSTNAKGSLSEFIAEVMSNRNLQKQLGERKWRLSDMWNGIKSAIMRMLGLEKVETMFGASVVAIEQLFVPSSVRNLGLKAPETVVSRKLSAKDIAALHSGSNSMRQFSEQFGDRIKQKDRTPEDVERIAAEVFDEMQRKVTDIVPMPVADKLDYTTQTIMSDGKQFDPDNALHYVEADAITFAALEAQNNKELRSREAREIGRQRIDDFKSLLKLLRENPDYTIVENALVAKAASKYAVISDKTGRLKLVELENNNRHGIAVVSREAADAVIQELRAGKGLKDAFITGLQKQANRAAVNNERKNGWQKFDQAKDDKLYKLEDLYTEEEVDAAFNQTGYNGTEFENTEELIATLVADGLLPYRAHSSPSTLEAAAIALNEGAAGTPWCTGASVSTARSQIESGDFYIYYKNGRPEVAVRMDGTDKIGEIRGNNPNQAMDAEQQKIAMAFLHASTFSNRAKYTEEFARKERLIKIAKGEEDFNLADAFTAGVQIDDSGVKDLGYGALQFRTFDGYGRRPSPSEKVEQFFKDKLNSLIAKAYSENMFLFGRLRINGSTNLNDTFTGKFNGVEYTTTIDNIVALDDFDVSLDSYDTFGEQLRKIAKGENAFVLPKLLSVKKLSLHGRRDVKGLELPSLVSVEEITFFSEKDVSLTLPKDAVVNKVRAYRSDGTLTINGPQQIEVIDVYGHNGNSPINLNLPDTLYFRKEHDSKALAMEGAEEKGIDKVKELFETAVERATGEAVYSFDTRRWGRGALEDKKRVKAFDAAAADINDRIEGGLRKIKFASKKQADKFSEALYVEIADNEEGKKEDGIKNAILSPVSHLKFVQNALKEAAAPDKAFLKFLKDVFDIDSKIVYAKIDAPNFIAETPPVQTLTEAPEQVRFAPKNVGVQEEKPGVYSFKRKREETSITSVAQEPSFIDKFFGNLFGLAGRVQFVDQYAALDEVAKRGMSAGQISSAEATNAQYLLRFGQQVSQFAGQFMTNGAVVLETTKENGIVKSLYRSIKGTSMMDVAQALNAAKLGNDTEQEAMFTMYLAGERAKQVGWGKLNFADPAKAQAEYQTVMNKLAATPQAAKAFAAAKQLYQQYNAGLLDFLVQTGALTAQKAAELKAITYVPFYRVAGNGEVQLMIDKEHPIRIANIKDQPQLKELVGGNTAIMPVFASAAQNTFMITRMGLRNQAVKETAFMLQKLGMTKAVKKGHGPTDVNTVRFFMKGEPHYVIVDTDAFGVPAELVVRGMEGVKTTLPAIVKALGVPATLLRNFVVRNPAYAVRQVIRDPLTAWFTTGTDSLPVLSSMKELATMVAGRSETERKLMETGAVSSNVYTGDERDMAKFLKDVSTGRSGWDKAVARLDAFALQGDAATRAVIYRDSLAKGMSEQEALLRTMESMNFSRRGVSPSIQFLNTLIPFFNAQIQGLDVLYRAFKGDMPFSKQLEIRKKLIQRGVMLGAMTIVYAAMMEDDEAYKRARPEERYGNWFVYIPGVSEPMRVPIPFELGYLFKALPEAVWNMAAQDEKASYAVKGIGKLLAQSNPLSLPQAIKPLTEVYLGKSFFGGDIESQREKQMLPEERYRENTTELSKLLGSVTGKAGVSPISLDYLIRGYTGGLGVALVQLANPVLASDTRAEIAKPSLKPSKTPFIGGLFQPVEGRGTLDEAYDRMTEIRQVKGTFNRLVEEGRRAEALEFAQRNANELAMMSVSGKVQQQLGQLAKVERQIRANPSMTTEQKDARLKQLDEMKVKIARQFTGR